MLRQALTPDVVALLNLLQPEWTINLSAAQGELFVAIEQFCPWFARAGKRVAASDYVELGETLDIVDGLSEGMRAGRARA